MQRAVSSSFQSPGALRVLNNPHWFDAGLGPNEAEIAHALLQHGVLPRHLKIVVEGRSAVTLYRDTRSVERLVATLRGDGHL